MRGREVGSRGAGCEPAVLRREGILLFFMPRPVEAPRAQSATSSDGGISPRRCLRRGLPVTHSLSPSLLCSLLYFMLRRSYQVFGARTSHDT